MPAPSPDGFTRTITSLLLEPGGAILACVVTTDYESFHSALTPIPDIVRPMTGGQLDAAYQGNFWLTGLCRAPSGALYACDADGSVHDNATGAWRVTPVTPGRGLRAIKALPDGTILTGGTSGQVFRSDGSSPFLPLLPETGTWINAFAGSGFDSFIVVADEGVAIQWQGGSPARIELATDATLNDAFLNGSEYILIGANGLILRGSEDAWTDLSDGTADLFEIARYGDELWIAAGPNGILRLAPTGLDQIRKTFTAHRIVATGEFAAFAGDNLVFRHDRAAWPGYRFG